VADVNQLLDAINATGFKLGGRKLGKEGLINMALLLLLKEPEPVAALQAVLPQWEELRAQLIDEPEPAGGPGTLKATQGFPPPRSGSDPKGEHERPKRPKHKPPGSG
jgi:hypothetical protein